MAYFVQYNKADGQIMAAVMTDRKPLIPADHPTTAQLELAAHVEIEGKRVNLETLTLESCPIYAKWKHNDEILYKLKQLDEKTPRALREKELTGSTARLQEIEDEANVLRAQLLK